MPHVKEETTLIMLTISLSKSRYADSWQLLKAMIEANNAMHPISLITDFTILDCYVMNFVHTYWKDKQFEGYLIEFRLHCRTVTPLIQAILVTQSVPFSVECYENYCKISPCWTLAEWSKSSWIRVWQRRLGEKKGIRQMEGDFLLRGELGQYWIAECREGGVQEHQN